VYYFYFSLKIAIAMINMAMVGQLSPNSGNENSGKDNPNGEPGCMNMIEY
jgi:hypothetical protein